MKQIFSLVLLLLAHGAVVTAQEKAPPPPPNVLALLKVEGSFNKPDYREVIKMGERVFPELERLLRDPTMDPLVVGRIFGVILSVQADRSRFIEPGVSLLANPDSTMRFNAAGFLGKIGSRAEAVPIVALLFDRDITINWAAIEALAALGGEPELVALDIWSQCNAESLRIDEQRRQHLEQSRDALQKRVAEERKKPGVLAGQRQPDRTGPSVQEVRQMLTGRPGNPTPVTDLIALGERAYPALEALLNDPAVTDFEALRVFEQLPLMPGDRSRFAPYAVRWLRSYRPRWMAINLLGAIGSRRDAAPLAALLFDPNPDFVRLAVEALGKLGGEREKVAIDISMQAKTADLSAAEQARDAILKRGEEEKKKGG